MSRKLNIIIEDDEYKKLIKIKNGLTWRELLLSLTDLNIQRKKSHG